MYKEKKRTRNMKKVITIYFTSHYNLTIIIQPLSFYYIHLLRANVKRLSIIPETRDVYIRLCWKNIIGLIDRNNYR